MSHGNVETLKQMDTLCAVGAHAAVWADAAGDGRLSGQIERCNRLGHPCFPVAARVFVLPVRGEVDGRPVVGRPVGNEYAKHGRFSFVLPPGEYVPSTRAALGPRCITVIARVRAERESHAGVICFDSAR